MTKLEVGHHVPRDHRIVGAVYRTVRHGVGNHDGVPRAVGVAYVGIRRSRRVSPRR